MQTLQSAIGESSMNPAEAWRSSAVSFLSLLANALQRQLFPPHEAGAYKGQCACYQDQRVQLIDGSDDRVNG